MLIQFADIYKKRIISKDININKGQELYVVEYCGLSDENKPILKINNIIIKSVMGMVMNSQPLPFYVVIINDKYMADVSYYSKELTIPKVFKRNNYLVFEDLKNAQGFKDRTERQSLMLRPY